MLIKRSDGTKSWSLTILVATWAMITIKFMFGVDGSFMESISGSEYAVSLTPFLALFGHREHKKDD